MDMVYKIMLNGTKLRECRTLSDAQKWIKDNTQSFDDQARSEIEIVEQRRG